MRQRPTRRQYLSLTGGALLLGAAGEPAAAAESIADVRTPSDPRDYRFETMGPGGDAPRAYLFGNFKCPFTREFVLDNLQDVIREFVDPGDLRLQFLNVAYEPDHNMGRSSPTHSDSTYFISSSDPRIGRVSLGAWEVDPDSYWQFFQDMFENPPSGWVTYSDLSDRLRDSGVSNRDEIIARAKTDRYEDELRAAENAAQDFYIRATPRLALAGETVNPRGDVDDLLDWIEARIPDASASSSASTSSSDSGGSGGGSGAIGTVRLHQPSPGSWRNVSLSGHDDPVVVMGPATSSGGQPVHPRLRGVSDGGFQFKLEEWDYLNGRHVAENVSHLSFSAGTHALPGGTAVDAGRVRTDDDYTWIGFDADFDAEPVLLTQVMSYAGYDSVVARQANVTTSGASVRVQEAQRRGAHTTETVGYVAIEPGETAVGGAPAEAGRTADVVTDEWHRIDFSRTYDSPAFVASLHTSHGLDTANLRYRDLTGSGVSVRVEEERSLDRETNHTTEVVSYLVAER